jgi:hypothetical protein
MFYPFFNKTNLALANYKTIPILVFFSRCSVIACNEKPFIMYSLSFVCVIVYNEEQFIAYLLRFIGQFWVVSFYNFPPYEQ